MIVQGMIIASNKYLFKLVAFAGAKWDEMCRKI